MYKQFIVSMWLSNLFMMVAVNLLIIIYIIIVSKILRIICSSKLLGLKNASNYNYQCFLF